MNASSGHFSLPPEQMRELGYRVVDHLVEHFDRAKDRPAARVFDRASMEALFREPIPETGRDAHGVLDRVMADVLYHAMFATHPRFFAWVPSPANFIGSLAGALVEGFSTFSGTWMEASAPSMVELVTIDWLRQLMGMPVASGGLFTSGGSMANLTGLAVARHAVLGEDFEQGVVYFSDQTHFSVERALRILGFRSSQLRKLPSDGGYRLSAAEVRKVIQADRERGLQPFCIVANAGTTNTGAVDPLAELVALCGQQRLWLHVDGAYGAAAALTDQGRQLLAGLEMADSLAIDPHKWLFQPYEIGAVLVRDAALMRDTFRMMPEYLKDIDRSAEEVNFADYGVQLTRSFRALKLWMSLQVFGLDAFRAAISWGIRLAEIAEDRLRRNPIWEIVTPAQLGVVSFRYRPRQVPGEELDALQRRVVQAVIDDGWMMISSTVLRGRTVLRMCPLNPQNTESEMIDCVRHLEMLAGRVAAEE